MSGSSQKFIARNRAPRVQIEYDVELANEYLDMVIPERGDDGYRLRPDGEPMTLIYTVPNNLSYGTNWVQTAELLIGYWDAVGVRVQLNSVADDQFTNLYEANDIQITMYTGEGGAGLTGMLDPRYYVPGEQFGLYGNGWFFWYVNSQEATQVEPPEEIQAIRAQFEEVGREPTQEEQVAAMQELIQIAADNFWVIGISRPGPGFQPYNTRIGNQPDECIAGWIEGVQKLQYPEQWYIIQ